VPHLTRAWLVTRDGFDMPTFWRSVEALDGTVDPTTRISLLLEGRKLTGRASRWLLHNRRAAGMEVLRNRVRRLAATGRLRVTERRAVDLFRAASTGTVFTLLCLPCSPWRHRTGTPASWTSCTTP
jgi:NAD-specific glutamate dehydrogenase